MINGRWRVVNTKLNLKKKKNDKDQPERWRKISKRRKLKNLKSTSIKRQIDVDIVFPGKNSYGKKNILKYFNVSDLIKKDMSLKHIMKQKDKSGFNGINIISTGEYKQMLQLKMNITNSDIRFSKDKELTLGNSLDLKCFVFKELYILGWITSLKFQDKINTSKSKSNVFFNVNQILYKVFGNTMLLKNKNQFQNIEYILDQTKKELKKNKKKRSIYELLLTIKDCIEKKITSPIWFTQIINQHKHSQCVIQVD